MARNYEPLTALDHSFLLLERPNAYMHVASTAIHDARPLRNAEGGIDLPRIRRAIAGVLHRIPRYRQKLAFVPIDRSPVWVDDEGFNLDYHIRHTSLPRPGDERQIKQLSARVMAQRLDRARPLWELWVVEGLEGDRLALISKTHHCMIDGVSGVDLLNVILSPNPTGEIVEAPPFAPRPAPSPLELLRDELQRRTARGLLAFRNARALLGEARDARREILVRLRAAAETVGIALRPASATPLNQSVGPHRRFDWWSLPLADLKRVRRRLGGSLNDVVLTVVTGAVRRFFEYRRVDVTGLDFRVMAPVSVRKTDERGALGNRVSAWFVPLPLSESDPARQLRAISQNTAELKESKSAVGAELLTQVADWTPTTLLSLGARNLTRLQSFNLVVTNVPGPQAPLFLLGSHMKECYPMVPIMEGLGLGIALFSYDGKLCWGFNADYELVPDLDRFVTFTRESFAELLAASGERPTLSEEPPSPAAPEPVTPAAPAPAAPEPTAPAPSAPATVQSPPPAPPATPASETPQRPAPATPAPQPAPARESESAPGYSPESKPGQF